MDLKSLSDKILLKNTEDLVRKENELLLEILHHLREIEKRRLFSALGFSSLFSYATSRLGYSEDQAYRRISAMRLLREIPEIEEEVRRGEINLTHLGMAQNAFKKRDGQSVSREVKVQTLKKIAGSSKREAEKTLFEICPVIEAIPDRIRASSEGRIELRFEADEKLEEKINEIKGLLAHKYPNMSLGELMNYLCDMGIEKLNESKKPLVRIARIARKTLPMTESASGGPVLVEELAQSPAPARVDARNSVSFVYISVSLVYISVPDLYISCSKAHVSSSKA